MNKLSKHYRNDDTSPIDPTLRKYLDKEYLQTLENLDVVNPKVLVVFSGGNAAGKSTLSAKIAKELGGLVIENDAIKRTILRRMPDIDKLGELNPLTWQYSMDLYRRLPELTSNGLIVRDGVIDWYFDRILPTFERMGYKIFVVQYDINKEKAAELIEARGDTPTTTVTRLLHLFDDHVVHQKRFRSQYNADIILGESNIFDHDEVIKKLRSVITGLNSTTSSSLHPSRKS